jgi:protein gp37
MNFLAGVCPHLCQYCSTQKFYYPVLKEKYSGEIRLNEKAMNENLGHGNYIFVCSQMDLFAESIPLAFIAPILERCKKYDNQYLFQTKNPARLIKYVPYLPVKSTICTTIETNRIYPEMGNTPSPFDRAIAMSLIDLPKLVTLEPLMAFDLEKLINLVKISKASTCNIGANSYNKIKLPEPTKAEVLELIAELEKFAKVNLKSNLSRLIK